MLYRLRAVLGRTLAILKRSWEPLGWSWGRLGTILGHLERSCSGRKTGRQTGRPQGLYLSDCLPDLGRSWAILKRSWEPPGRSWGRLGTVLGPSWSIWGALAAAAKLVDELADDKVWICQIVCQIQGGLGVSLRHLGAFLGVSWMVLGSSWDHLGASWALLQRLQNWHTNWLTTRSLSARLSARFRSPLSPPAAS